MTQQNRELYEFGPFRIDPSERLLLREGQPVSVTSKAFDALLVLIRRSGHLVEKSELMTAVWGRSFVEEGNLTVAISTIRKALGDDGGDGRKYIQTVARRGYRFLGEVHGVDVIEVEKPAVVFAPSAPRREAPLSLRFRVRALKVAAMMLVCLGITISFGHFLRPSAAPAAIRSLAVLPFRILSGDAAHTNLGLGVPNALITRLSGAGDIIVRPTSAILKYTSSQSDPVAIGREQKVDAILAGNIEDLPDQVRVSVQLVRTRDGGLLWGATFADSPRQMGVFEDRVVERIVQSMSAFFPAGVKVLPRRDTDNFKAYELYLQGRYFWDKRTQQGLSRSIEYLQQATSEDPQYARAYAGLADSYVLMDSYGLEPSRQAYPNAKTAALTALRIDDSLAEAHASLGMIAFNYEWDWSKAEEEFQRSFVINRYEAHAHKWYAQYLRAMGLFERALDEARTAQKLDPLSLNVLTEVGLVYYSSRQYPQAIDAFQGVIDLDPQFVRAHIRLGMTYVAQRDFRNALREFEKAKGLSTETDPYVDGFVGYAQALSGHTDEARRILARLVQRSRARYVPPFDIALVYIGLGERDHALEWLESAYQERSTYLAYAKTDPMFDPVRSDPRFAALLRRMGLS
jgi:DNA-binding winged helix-turn-helix (wHTH) protein/TolB-like protein/Flp pilus assembly protein TadD